MKFIRVWLGLILVLASCTKNRHVMSTAYKLLSAFSQKVKSEKGLILDSYTYNWWLSKDYVIKNGIGDFDVSYTLVKTKNDKISIGHARDLIVFLAENLLQDINSSKEVRPKLDVYPFTNDLIGVMIYFKDENDINLGQGVAVAHLDHGRIKYEGYHIHEYKNSLMTRNKYHLIHEESYADALEIVKKRRTLKMLSS